LRVGLLLRAGVEGHEKAGHIPGRRPLGQDFMAVTEAFLRPYQIEP
jgi:hypothetical protein